jgi:hypothetical protein
MLATILAMDVGSERRPNTAGTIAMSVSASITKSACSDAAYSIAWPG